MLDLSRHDGCSRVVRTKLKIKARDIVTRRKPRRSMWTLSGLSWKQLLVRVWNEMNRDDVFGDDPTVIALEERAADDLDASVVAELQSWSTVPGS